MDVKTALQSGLRKKIPDARVFADLQLDARRNGGERADLCILHRSGVYLVLIEDLDGMLYGSEQTGQWKLKKPDGRCPIWKIRSAKAFDMRNCWRKK